MNIVKPLHRQAIGRWGETAAAQYLTSQGYEILERNLRTPYGEIDLVAQIEGTIVFIEVKARTGTSLGPPEVSVGSRKQAHMLACAQFYIQEHAEQADGWRIDVIAVQRQAKGQLPLITHFENVLT